MAEDSVPCNQLKVVGTHPTHGVGNEPLMVTVAQYLGIPKAFSLPLAS